MKPRAASPASRVSRVQQGQSSRMNTLQSNLGDTHSDAGNDTRTSPRIFLPVSMNRMMGLQLKNRMECRHGRVLLGEHDGHRECLRLVRARKHVCR